MEQTDEINSVFQFLSLSSDVSMTHEIYKFEWLKNNFQLSFSTQPFKS